MGLFGKEPQRSPSEQAREWNRKLRQETRVLDRQIMQIQREEDKVKKQIKDAAKKGDTDVCKILAREVVQSHKAIAKLYTAKAQINSVCMSMNNQLASMRMAGCMQKSAEVMKNMSSLVKVSEVSAIMQQLSKEMMKAGIIDEMMEDTLEGMEPEEMEEEIQNEVDKVLFEITAGELGRAPAVVEDSLVPAAASKVPAKTRAKAGPSQAAAVALADDDDNDDLDAMEARLQRLKS